MKRVIETAASASELCKKEIKILDFCSEDLAGDDFIIPYNNTIRWLFQHPDYYHYKCISPNEMRVSLFAHHIAGTLFLSSVLDIPLPMLMMRFEICHTGVTVLEFKDEGGYCTPRVITYSNDAHIYKEGLP